MISAAALLDTITAPLLADPSFPPGWVAGFLQRQRGAFEGAIAQHLLPLFAPEQSDRPPPSSAAAVLAAQGLTITEELTTPKREGKKPRPVWVVRGTVREQAPVMKAAGGRWWAGAWSYYEDPTQKLAAAFQGLPAPPPALPEPGARPAAPVASQGPPPAPARAPVPPGVFVPEVYRRVLSLPLDDLPVNDILKRYSGMTEITAAVRSLFKSLGLPEVRATLDGSHARVKLPDIKAPSELKASYWEGGAFEGTKRDHPLWPVFRLRGAAEKQVEKILALAFPNLRDKSDIQSDYFNFVFTSGFYDPTPQTKGDTSIADPDALQPAAAPARPAPAAPRPLGDSDRAARAAKLRELAATAEKDANKKRSSGLYNANPTRRRAGILASLEQDAEHLELLRGKLLALADALEGRCEPPTLAGCLPGSLEGVDSRALLEALIRGREIPVPLMYGVDLSHLVDKAKGKKGLTLARAALEDLAETCRERACPVTTPSRLEAIEKVARALPGDYAARGVLDRIRDWRRAVAAGLGTEEKWKQAVADVAALGKAAPVQAPAERWIRDAERALIGRKIPGYFPTPPALVQEMIIEAELRPGDRVLEPSAGKGDIALAIRAAGAEPDVLEVITDLRDILELKGLHLVGRDFLSYEPGPVYDAVIMNPPFEDLADIDHVRHAYELVKPGGRVVAIMGESPFFRQGRKAEDFRLWLAEVGGESRKNPDKAFMDSDRPTGVSTRLVVIHKRTA